MRTAWLFLLGGALHAQALQGIVAASGVSGPAAPAFVSSAGASIAQGLGNTFVLSAINVSSGQFLVLSFGVHGSGSVNYCATVTGVTATGGDTWTQAATKVNSSAFTACSTVYYMASPTPSGSYVITIQASVTAPAALSTSVMTFSKGSLAGTVDGSTCNGSTNGATAVACSAALSPTGTVELAVYSAGGYDNITGSEADNSSTAFTIPSGCKVSSILGGLFCGYYIGNPPAGSLTPGVTSFGSGDPIAIVGIAFK